MKLHYPNSNLNSSNDVCESDYLTPQQIESKTTIVVPNLVAVNTLEPIPNSRRKVIYPLYGTIAYLSSLWIHLKTCRALGNEQV